MTDQNKTNDTAEGFGSLIVQETAGQNIAFHNNTTELSAVSFGTAQTQYMKSDHRIGKENALQNSSEQIKSFDALFDVKITKPGGKNYGKENRKGRNQHHPGESQVRNGMYPGRQRSCVEQNQRVGIPGADGG